MCIALRTVAAALAAFPLPAQQPRTELAAPTEALVFKSGHAFLYREAAIEAGSESTRLRLPDAIHGTVWLGSNAVEIRRGVARRATTIATRKITDLGGVLRRAVGGDVRLTLRYGADGPTEYAAGRLLRVVSGPANQPMTIYGGAVQPFAPPAATLLVLQSGEAVETFPVSAVVAVRESQASANASLEYADEVEVPVLDVAHAALPAGAQGTIGMAAMTGGLAWTPSYVLELGDDGGSEARLVGKAVLVDDAEKLEGTRVRLAVGYPNLQFANVRSSLSPDVSLDAFRQLLGAGDAANDRGRRSVMTQAMSNVGDWSLREGGAAIPGGPATALPGEASEDLYLYDVGKVTLAKGERAYLPLLDAKAPFTHRFDWELPDQVDRSARFVERPDDDAIPVWHVLVLQNTTQAPWTTAPILVQAGKGPIAQSMLKYTPAGGEAQVKLTQALNLVGKSVEVRADDAKAPRTETILFQNRYEEVEVVGRLELTNRSQRATPMRVRKDFSGDVVSMDGEPKLEGRAKGLGQVNASRTATWTFELAPGATWTAGYRYRVLIQR